ncbi:MAG: YicC family protein [Deltaproteobacteria bacterium]|jgi:uncharacterized protein (TIGR00255 family)|nr:YicC family protein [Deltaproteobacteria bacterium]
MNSMTGYGRGEATNGDISVVVEIKTVNNRFRDVNLRVPREYLVLEPRVNKTLKDAIQRGRVDVYISRTAVESGQTVRPDPILAEHYLRAATAVAQRLQRLDEPLPLTWLLAQPGVLTTTERERDALSEWDVVSTALDAALSELAEMRAAEGGALAVELRGLVDQLLAGRAAILAASADLTDRLHQRLSDRVRKLLGDRIDPYRLAQEAALLADKADITEEVARLSSHCDQLLASLDAVEPIGRRLEFLVQELHREVNTIGSKAAEHAVANQVVEMKSTIERLREQAANVE